MVKNQKNSAEVNCCSTEDHLHQGIQGNRMLAGNWKGAGKDKANYVQDSCRQPEPFCMM